MTGVHESRRIILLSLLRQHCLQKSTLFWFLLFCFSLQACLGVSAKVNERNVVALTTEDGEGEEMKHVIVSLRLEKNEQVLCVCVCVCVCV